MGWEDSAERAAERAAGKAANKAAKRVEKGISNFGSSLVWSIGFGVVFIGIFGCVVCGVGGYVGWLLMAPSPGGGGSLATSSTVEVEATWDGTSTFKCGGNDKKSLSGVTATVDGVGIEAGGNCNLTLTDVSVTAGTALKAGGNAKITMVGGSLEGKDFSIQAGGNAKVDLLRTATKGKVKSSGLAKVTGAK